LVKKENNSKDEKVNNQTSRSKEAALVTTSEIAPRSSRSFDQKKRREYQQVSLVTSFSSYHGPKHRECTPTVTPPACVIQS
jgi:hypothetical protein